MMDKQNLNEGINWLAEGGLNLFAVFDCGGLPTAVSQFMLSNNVPLADHTHLVLIGHGGKTLWSQLQKSGMNTVDPVDSYSLTLTQQFIHNYLDSAPSLIVYPSETFLVPLGQLGELAGWSHPSPLGQGINAEYGVWFAYRAAFLTTADLPIISTTSTDSPCLACVDRPCLAACPVGATNQNGRFSINLCSQHRLQPNSSCADRCLARIARPNAPQHQYTLPQIKYHYQDSLKTLKKYYST